MLVFPFLSSYRAYHQQNSNFTTNEKIFLKKEKIFLSIFQLGIFEVYQYLYGGGCQSDEDFKDWIIALKGKDFYYQAEKKFVDWENGNLEINNQPIDVLTEDQHLFWQLNGFLQIEQVVKPDDCDAVIKIITDELKIDLANPQTWYPQSEKLKGLMLQIYQGDAIAKIRNSDLVKNIFHSLYKSTAIVPNCEKLSYNPPENENFKFAGSSLHWDIDFNIGPRFYIQGLVYLNDVPENRGPLTLIPGYHKKIEQILATDSNPHQIMETIKNQNLEKKLPGKKGDLLLWLETLPHAASPNQSDFPRFVQYVSFIQLDTLD